MKNKEDNLLIEICDMLLHPDDYKSLSIKSICASLKILNCRIIKSDTSILSNSITKDEYEEYFEELFTSSDLVGMNELIVEIKEDIKKMGEIKK